MEPGCDIQSTDYKFCFYLSEWPFVFNKSETCQTVMSLQRYRTKSEGTACKTDVYFTLLHTLILQLLIEYWQQQKSDWIKNTSLVYCNEADNLDFFHENAEAGD